EPDLAGHRLAGRGPDHLDTATRPDRPSCAEVGTETAPAAAVLDRCPHHPPRPPHQVAAVGDCAVVRRDRRCDRPPDSTTSTDLTSTKPTNRDGRHLLPGQWNLDLNRGQRTTTPRLTTGDSSQTTIRRCSGQD